MTAYLWCKSCCADKFKEDFSKWTSGDAALYEFIRTTQLTATSNYGVMEWIPYDELRITGYLSRGGYGELQAYYECASNANQINHCFGITRAPETDNIGLVLANERFGDLGNYVRTEHANLTWLDRVELLWNVADGLQAIHSNGLVHRDFHSGNILVRGRNTTTIADLGLCRQVDNFGIIMWQVASGKKPFRDVPYDTSLAIKLCRGTRPPIMKQMPDCLKELMQQCWHDNPSMRPTSAELKEKLWKWLYDYDCEEHKQIALATRRQQKRQNSGKNTDETQTESSDSQSTHPQARYYSTLLPTQKLRELIYLILTCYIR
ncbi:6008_t:CDS:2 [Paraglomus occultum]|uniref:6008_t:CDS:1 n=1 Tax=Paraglomus occultum TaxID=144539 RepID=A0A9N8Z3G8_9GLOM|nr:6008_t:CDS:2 [Paraglomus occultum]